MTEMTDREFEEALEGVRVRIWFCPVRKAHPDRPGPTVEWDDGVACCTYGPCGRRSDDPNPRGECLCDGDTSAGEDCTGQCCGPGQCSCSPGSCSRCGRSGAHTCKGPSVTGSSATGGTAPYASGGEA